MLIKNQKSQKKDYYIGLWNEESEGKIVAEMPESTTASMEDFEQMTLMLYDEDDKYLFKEKSSLITKLSQDFASQKDYTLQNNILWGIIRNPDQNTIYWYGIQNEQFGIWSLEKNKTRIEAFDKIGKFDNEYIHAVCTSSDNIYLTDGKTLWKSGKAGQIEEIGDFLEQGYVIDNIYGMSEKDETIYLMTLLENEYYLLTVKEEEKPQDKQEIILATSSRYALGTMVAKFNRRSDKYHIILKEQEKSETYASYLQRLQLEIAEGNSPDLFDINEMYAIGYARNGYFQSLENLLEDTDTLWPEALEAAKIDGIQYGIPYKAGLSTTVFSAKVTGERDTWTIEEMMEAVRSSDAELLADGQDAYAKIIDLVIWDKSNKDYIDWENGKSHLKEQPFLDVMSFAKEYLSTRQQFTEYEYQRALRNGLVASESQLSITLGTLGFYYNAFGGAPSFVGSPRKEGSGVYVITSNLYMGSTTDKQEGIQEFLRFLLSDEIQYESAIDDYCVLPVRLSVMEDLIQYYRSEHTSFGLKGISATV